MSVLKRLGAVDGDKISVRNAYGKLSGIISMVVNLFLAVSKLLVGFIFSSISLIADGMNNLSDIGSAVVSFVSFKIVAMPADKEHPYGHARAEYIAYMVVAIIILLLGLDSARSAIVEIISPKSRVPSVLEFVVLCVAIFVKLILGLYNLRLGRRIDSKLLMAVAQDSFSDVMSSLAVLVAAVIQFIYGVMLDGVAGLLVSVLIIWSGINIIRDALDKLLGEPPTREFAESIENFVMGFDGILGVHDLIIHDYGPGRCFVSLHAEVDAEADVLDSHDLIDDIERQAVKALNVNMVLHMDPIQLNSPILEHMSGIIGSTLGQLSPMLSFHDLRVVDGKLYRSVIFDVIVPYECNIPQNEILIELKNVINKYYENATLVVTFDRSYVR